MSQNKPLMLGIAGPSCAGKTELTRRLLQYFKERGATLSLDSYYRDLSHMDMPERKKNNFDAPEALDSDLLIKHVRDLASGRSIEKPVYRFDVHTRAEYSECLLPGEIVIVEGLFAFYWKELRELFGLKVFISATEETSFKRRLVRDTRERAASPEFVIEQYRRDVWPMYEECILPTRIHADMEVDGETNIEETVAKVLKRIENTTR